MCSEKGVDLFLMNASESGCITAMWHREMENQGGATVKNVIFNYSVPVVMQITHTYRTGIQLCCQQVVFFWGLFLIFLVYSIYSICN